MTMQAQRQTKPGQIEPSNYWSTDPERESWAHLSFGEQVELDYELELVFHEAHVSSDRLIELLRDAIVFVEKHKQLTGR